MGTSRRWGVMWWFCVTFEVLFYLFCIIFWSLFYFHQPCQLTWNSAISSPFGFLLPQAKFAGWGGASFISVTVGFNLALVKFESFLKSLDEVKSRWEQDVLKDLKKSGAQSAMADEGGFEKVINQKVQAKLIEANEFNARWWRMSRWWSQRLFVIGLLFLFTQHSAGLLALVMCIPAVVAWVTKSWARHILKSDTSSIVKGAEMVRDMLAKDRNAKITAIEGRFPDERTANPPDEN